MALVAAARQVAAVPRRLGAMLRCLLSRDPAIGVAMFAAYALFTGLSLVIPGQVFRPNSVYSVIMRLGIPRYPAGLAMVADAAALLWCLHPRASATARAIVGILSGAFWGIWGVLLIAGALSNGFLSSAGVWTVTAAAFVAFSAAGWSRHLPSRKDI